MNAKNLFAQVCKLADMPKGELKAHNQKLAQELLAEKKGEEVHVCINIEVYQTVPIVGTAMTLHEIFNWKYTEREKALREFSKFRENYRRLKSVRFIGGGVFAPTRGGRWTIDGIAHELIS